MTHTNERIEILKAEIKILMLNIDQSSKLHDKDSILRKLLISKREELEKLTA